MTEEVLDTQCEESEDCEADVHWETCPVLN